MKKVIWTATVALVGLVLVMTARAQVIRPAQRVGERGTREDGGQQQERVPNGKGGGEPKGQAKGISPFGLNGINYHGGPMILGTTTYLLPLVR